MKTVRLRLVLPLLFLLLSVSLTITSERARWARLDAIVARYHSLYEPPSDLTAKGRYLDFAINAPAWVAAWDTPPILRISLGSPIYSVLYGRIMRYEWHWWYYAYLLVMWFIIGKAIDDKRTGRQSHGRKSRTRIIKSVALLLYGVFVAWVTVNFDKSGYLFWFKYFGYAWGLILVIISFRVLWSYVSYAASSNATIEL